VRAYKTYPWIEDLPFSNYQDDNCQCANNAGKGDN